jgi:hypothetical protein
MKPNFEMKLHNSDKARKKKEKYVSSGIIISKSVILHQKPTFVEYVKGGCQLRLMVAIDFTGSNGDPRLPESLHYWHESKQNMYQQAINAVGSILAPYDSDQKIHAWGFGAKVNGNISHCFPLTLDDKSTEVDGLDGLMKYYKNALFHVGLSGPTLFHPVISKAAELTSAEKFSQANQHYSILMILTDGQMGDDIYNLTVESIQKAAEQPMSIIIIGIGDDSFENMRLLDGDDMKGDDGFVIVCFS